MSYLTFTIMDEDDYWAKLNGVFIRLSGKGRQVILEKGDKIGWKNAVAEVVLDGRRLALSAPKEVLDRFSSGKSDDPVYGREGGWP